MAPGPEDGLAAPSPGGESVMSGTGGGDGDGAGGAGHKREASGTPADDLAGRKKKKTGPGSRGVANLTPDQLAKKRANDREAQRAIRERTKNQIENLERRIQELTSQQPYQELQAVLRAKEAVEQENADIKRRLAGIVSMLQPLIGQAAIEQAYISPAQTYAPPPIQHPSTLSVHSNNNHHAASTPGSASSPASHDASQQQWQQGANSNSIDAQARTQLSQQRHELRHNLELGPERLGLDFLLDSTHRVNRIQNGLNGAQDTGQFQHAPMKHDWTGVSSERALQARPASNWGSPGAMDQQPQTHSPHSYHQQPHHPRGGLSTGDMSTPSPIPPRSDPSLADYAAPIKNCDPTCPLDALLIDFLSERRQRAADGLPTQEVVGPRYPSVSSLLNPANSAFSHPLSKVFTDILGTFPDISNLPERVAVLYMMFLVMRWQIDPSQDNYDRLPEWMAPLPSQLAKSHPAWIDHVPFPKMRERLVKHYNPQQYLFDNFFVPFTTTLSLSWPYEDTDTLLQSLDGDELMINPVFERHLRNLDNWKLGDAFAKVFPTLVDTFNLDTRGRQQQQQSSGR